MVKSKFTTTEVIKNSSITPTALPTTTSTSTRFRPILIWGTVIVLAYLPLLDLFNRSLLGQPTTSNQSDGVQHHVKVKKPPTFPPLIDPVDGFPNGILSRQPPSFFEPFRKEIDNADLADRCARYGFSMTVPPNSNNATHPTSILPRRIFYGSLIADEPWELFDIVATEVKDLFYAMVFVESNRTQHFYPRPLKRANNSHHSTKLQHMFNATHLQLRTYSNEDSSLMDLSREHAQRQEIIQGWKELGMTPHDVGYIADADETFSRDFLRAIQYCPYIEALDYETHHCLNVKAKIIGYTRVFETSPECVVAERSWFHPDIIVGACIEEIGDTHKNIVAPRAGFKRAQGYGKDCDPGHWQEAYGNIVGDKHPLFSAGDFRSQCGGRMYENLLASATNHTKYSAFHLHNFFANFQATRHKYKTYGHPISSAMTDRLETIAEDLKLMVRCVLDQTDGPTIDGVPNVKKQSHVRERGGINATLPPWPIYFQDAEYRQRKHALIKRLVMEDEQLRLEQLNLSQPELEIEQYKQEVEEAHRLIHDRETRMKALRQKHRIPPY